MEGVAMFVTGGKDRKGNDKAVPSALVFRDKDNKWEKWMTESGFTVHLTKDLSIFTEYW